MESTPAVQVFVNGDSVEVPFGSNITGVLTALQIPADRVAVELDKNLVRKRHWDITPVPAGAKLEVVEFVGGG